MGSDFLVRFGYENPVIELQEDETPDTLLSGLWDATNLTFFQNLAHYDIIGKQQRYSDEFAYITRLIWFHHYRETLDRRPEIATQTLKAISHRFFNSKFYDVYSFIEFMARLDVSGLPAIDGGQNYARFCNSVLEREKSGFRFADTTLVKVSSAEELDEVAEAISQSDSKAVAQHTRRAAELFSQRPIPDYRNSIKESISAVEAAVMFVSGKKTGGVSRPLRQVTESFNIHPALRDGFEKLYAYTSDEGGIRHALMDENDVTLADAKYMLVACSAFSNYLISFKKP